MVTQCPNYRVIDPVKHKLTLIIRGNSSRPETDGCWHCMVRWTYVSYNGFLLRIDLEAQNKKSQTPTI